MTSRADPEIQVIPTTEGIFLSDAKKGPEPRREYTCSRCSVSDQLNSKVQLQRLCIETEMHSVGIEKHRLIRVIM